ncbi:hypothetical protein ACIBAC_42665 [Streptomyces sp. NPDC051362]|uniref:hypothetical protein n=1 Tax=Streptomyces sp. NPDC051362 TaxID=3365651 RepID=UPI00378B8C56
MNLFVDSASYTGIARASYETDGRLAYSLLLWPRPDRSPSGWYWYDPARMRRRIYPDTGLRP